MKRIKLFDQLLIIIGLLTLLGMIVNNNTLWSVINIIVILGCCGTEIYLLKISKST